MSCQSEKSVWTLGKHCLVSIEEEILHLRPWNEEQKGRTDLLKLTEDLKETFLKV
jgi:hypothetical protein